MLGYSIPTSDQPVLGGLLSSDVFMVPMRPFTRQLDECETDTGYHLSVGIVMDAFFGQFVQTYVLHGIDVCEDNELKKHFKISLICL